MAEDEQNQFCPRRRREHPHDGEIRRLRESGLSVAKIAEATGLSRTYLERAVYRVQFGEEAELRYRREAMRAYRDRKRERDAREKEQREREEAQRAANRARTRAWVEANPERHREQVERWAAEHPERRREIQRAWYGRNKDKAKQRMRRYDDAHGDEKRERDAKWRAENREYRSELQRRYRSDPDVNTRVLAANRERRQIVRRLEGAGLPPRALHPGTAKDRRQNEDAATGFFTRKRSRDELKRLKTEYVPPSAEMIARWESRSALSRARRAELEAVRAYVEEHGERLREETILDSRARVIRGAAPLDVDTEVEQRAREAVRRAKGSGAATQQTTRRHVNPNTGPHLPPAPGFDGGPRSAQ